MTDPRLVVVIGGTRGTGLLISRLLDRSGTPVRVLARDPERARTVLGPSVQIVRGDVTVAETIPPAVDGASHIIFTAGCRSGWPARESRVRRTEHEGVLNTLDAARRTGFGGRFLYMTSSGVGSRSFWTRALDLYKGNTLRWRHRTEQAIRTSGVEYTIIRTGFLLNAPGGEHSLELTQRSLPLSPRHRIARADVADVFVAAMEHPRAARATFEVVWSSNGVARFAESMDLLEPDTPGSAPAPGPPQGQNMRGRPSSLVVAIAALAIASGAWGCRTPHIETTPGGGIVVKSDRLGWYTKKVVTRQPPETLYAEDGTICRLAPERFRETKVGALLYCNWQ